MPKIKHNDYSALRASGRTTGSRPPDDGAALGFGAIGTTSLEQMSPTDREILLELIKIVKLLIDLKDPSYGALAPLEEAARTVTTRLEHLRIALQSEIQRN